MKHNQKIVISGGPGSGKTRLINLLKEDGYPTYEEYSRIIIKKGFHKGFKNYFKEDPNIFSEALFDGRKQQWESARKLPFFKKKPYVFFDRGIPDIIAYLQAQGKNIDSLKEMAKPYVYEHVFLLEPWLEIYHTDSERHETFEEAQNYFNHIRNTYQKLNGLLHIIPKETPENRIVFLLNTLGQYE